VSSETTEPAPEEIDRSDVIPGTGPFFRRLAKRKQSERDAVITVTARDADRGVGKSALATTLGLTLDTSESGFSAAQKATLSVQEFLTLYDNVEPGSALILDEAEQLDSRRSNSHENVDTTYKMQTRRVNEVIAILTLPSRQTMDKRVELLTDFWIDVERRGRAIVYKKHIHPIKKQTYFRRLQSLSWPNLDGHPDYERLAGMKDVHINDPESEDNWIRLDEHEARLERAEKTARRETRDELLRGIHDALSTRFGDALRYKDIAAGVDLSPQRVGQIIREED
jgi:hypothetical protein